MGWEVWLDGMEVTQFTYFQQVGGFDCNPVSGEITYGLERLAMYVQGVDRVFDLNFNGRSDARKLTYGDVFLQAEQEYSRFNFEFADTELLLAHFRDAEKECKALLEAGAPKADANLQRIAHVAGKAIDEIILATVRLVRDHHNISSIRENGMAVAFLFRKEFLDGREDHAPGCDLQLLTQISAICCLHR